MKPEDMTPEQIKELTEKLERYAELEKTHSKLVEDVKTLTSVGTNPELQDGAMGRLLQSTGMYTDQQIAEMVANARTSDAPDPKEVPDDDEGEIDRLLAEYQNKNAGDPEEVKHLQDQIDKMNAESRTRTVAELSRHIDERTAEGARKKIQEITRELAEQNGLDYKDPTDDSINFWTRDLNNRVKAAVQKLAKDTGHIPTNAQTDAIIDKILPERSKEIRSVMSDPALLRKVETVSGSTDTLDLTSEPVKAPELDDVVSGKITRDESRIQLDASRVDSLSRLAAASGGSKTEV